VERREGYHQGIINFSSINLLNHFLTKSLSPFCAQESDMEPLMQSEAKDFVIAGIEKATSSTGVDYKVSNAFFCRLNL